MQHKKSLISWGNRIGVNLDHSSDRMQGKKSLISWGNEIGVNLDHSSDRIDKIDKIGKNCQSRLTGQSNESYRGYSTMAPALGATAPVSQRTQRRSARDSGLLPGLGFRAILEFPNWFFQCFLSLGLHFEYFN